MFEKYLNGIHRTFLKMHIYDTVVNTEIEYRKLRCPGSAVCITNTPGKKQLNTLTLCFLGFISLQNL